MSFVEQQFGQKSPFTFSVPAELQTTLGLGANFLCRFSDDTEDFEEFMNLILQMQSLKLRTVKGE